MEEPIRNPESETQNRESSQAAFWDERFGAEQHLFGRAPNAFIVRYSGMIPAGGSVLDLGGGDGRNAVYLAQQGHYVTLVDFSGTALQRAGARAQEAGVSLRLLQADVAGWRPEEQWDAVVTTFLQLLPHERPVFYQLVQEALVPGGLFIALLFRPEQITEGYESGGPPVLDRTVTAEELRDHFPAGDILRLKPVVVSLEEGPHLSGKAAVLEFIYRKPG